MDRPNVHCVGPSAALKQAARAELLRKAQIVVKALTLLVKLRKKMARKGSSNVSLHIATNYANVKSQSSSKFFLFDTAAGAIPAGCSMPARGQPRSDID